MNRRPAARDSGRVRRRPRAVLISLLKRRFLVAAFYALLVAALLPGVLRLETDNSPEVYYLEGAPAVERFRGFQERFGSGESVRLVLEGEPIWTEPGLRWLGELEEEVASWPGVAMLAGPATAWRRLGSPWPPTEPAAFRDRFLALPLARDLGWVDRDGRLVTVLVELEGLPVEEGRALLLRLEQRLAGPPPGMRASVIGLPVLNRALDASSREIERRFFPLLVLFASGFLAVAFRQIAIVSKVLLLVAVCQVLVLGPMGYLGVKLNLVLAVLPSLLFAISLATTIHVLSRYRAHRQAGRSAMRATLAAYREKARAVVWTGLTTMVGFSALATSQVAPVRSLGIWAAIGLGSMTVAVLTLLPALLVIAPEGRPARIRLQELMSGAGRWLAEAAVRRRAAVLLVAAAVALASLVGLGRLQAESNALAYLAPQHPVRAAFERLEAAEIGVAALELVLEPAAASQPPGPPPPELLARLGELGASLRRLPEALGVAGPAEVVDSAVEESGLEVALGPEAARRQIAAELWDEGAVAHFVSAADGAIRVTILTRTVGLARLEPLLDGIEQEARRLFPERSPVVTGQLLLLLETQGYLLRTLGLSLGVTLLAVALVFRFLLGSTRLTLLVLLPNLWPVAGVLGVMGWTGVRLDIATVMVASISLGLAVDATIHTLLELRRQLPGLGRAEAIARTLERTAPAYILTGVVLAAGFGVCVLSDFAPIARFGGLAALAMLLALVADLLLIPALLGVAPRRALDG